MEKRKTNKLSSKISSDASQFEANFPADKRSPLPSIRGTTQFRKSVLSKKKQTYKEIMKINEFDKLVGKKANSKRADDNAENVNSQVEMLEECDEIRKKMKDEYMSLKSKFQNSKKNDILSHWKTIISLVSKAMPSIRMFVRSIKIMGDLYLEFDDFEKAKNYYIFFVF